MRWARRWPDLGDRAPHRGGLCGAQRQGHRGYQRNSKTLECSNHSRGHSSTAAPAASIAAPSCTCTFATAQANCAARARDAKAGSARATATTGCTDSRTDCASARRPGCARSSTSQARPSGGHSCASPNTCTSSRSRTSTSTSTSNAGSFAGRRIHRQITGHDRFSEALSHGAPSQPTAAPGQRQVVVCAEPGWCAGGAGCAAWRCAVFA